MGSVKNLNYLNLAGTNFEVMSTHDTWTLIDRGVVRLWMGPSGEFSDG